MTFSNAQATLVFWLWVKVLTVDESAGKKQLKIQQINMYIQFQARGEPLCLH